VYINPCSMWSVKYKNKISNQWKYWEAISKRFCVEISLGVWNKNYKAVLKILIIKPIFRIEKVENYSVASIYHKDQKNQQWLV